MICANLNFGDPNHSDLKFIAAIRRQEEDHGSEILRLLAPDGESSFQPKHTIDDRIVHQTDESRFSLFFIGSSCSLLAAVTILVSYKRRRQYDQRGMHKKVETLLS